MEDIVARLGAERGEHRDWAQGVIKDLARSSPTSLKITYRHVRAARGLDLRATLEQDYQARCRCMQGHDFYEGVRAALIDRDRSPRWQPARLEDVSEAEVDAYFAPLSVGRLQPRQPRRKCRRSAPDRAAAGCRDRQIVNPLF